MAIRLRCLLLLRLWLDIVSGMGYPVGVAGCPAPGGCQHVFVVSRKGDILCRLKLTLKICKSS